MALSSIPLLNAALNGATMCLLLAGIWAVKVGRVTLHKFFMVSALVMSTIFLSCYLYYHFNAEIMTTYTGSYPWLYYPILFSHIPLAGVIVPLCGVAVFFAVTDRLDRHRKFARILWPLWMYVSVTGVMIYRFLY